MFDLAIWASEVCGRGLIALTHGERRWKSWPGNCWIFARSDVWWPADNGTTLPSAH
jgi:hypothetical protein